MYRNNQNVQGCKLPVIVLIIVIMLLLFFQFAFAGNAASVRNRRQSNSQPEFLQSALSNFQTSLEMKENVDFLLTPALIVQEVISEDVVITYPSE